MPGGVKVLPQYLVERAISMHLPTHYKKDGGHWVLRGSKNDSIYKLPFTSKK
jgi:hypothetical protein